MDSSEFAEYYFWSFLFLKLLKIVFYKFYRIQFGKTWFLSLFLQPIYGFMRQKDCEI